MNAALRQPATLDVVGEFAAVARRFGDAVSWADPRARVASCPGWLVYNLVVHLGNVHAWAATILETGRSAPEHNDEPATGRAKALAAWYVGKAEDLYAVLRHCDPEDPCWNFVSDAGVAGFWPRRQLHETTIHLVDLGLSRARLPDLDPRICADGIDEVLTELQVRMHHRGRAPLLEQPLTLSATDTGDTWLLTPPATGGGAATGIERARVPSQPRTSGHGATTPPGVTRDAGPRSGPGAGDRVSGTADVLYRLLWHRPVEEGALRFDGDADRARTYLTGRLTP